jgi:hypothetical protein
MEARALHDASDSNKIKIKIQDFQSLTGYRELGTDIEIDGPTEFVPLSEVEDLLFNGSSQTGRPADRSTE